MRLTINFLCMWVFNFKIKYKPVIIGLLALLPISCEKIMIDEMHNASNKEVFEDLWNTLNERYSLFEVKNIDWDSIYLNYEPKITESLNENNLFSTLGNMIRELKDSHTDLHNKNQVVSYWPLDDSYMKAFDFEVVRRKYLLTDISTINAVTYGIINDIGYIYIKNFNEEINKDLATVVLTSFSTCKALIFDLRNNTGGNEAYGNNFIQLLLDNAITNKLINYKNGKSHNSFTTAPVILEPDGSVDFNGDIVVLINRATYSAANSFTNTISLLPNVTLIGDTTGGGGSLPINYELSNGWILRYSSTFEQRPSDSLITEKGIPPNYFVAQIKNEKKDNVLDFALNYLNSN